MNYLDAQHRLTPRNRRLIAALLVGPLPREEADRVAGASNSPRHIQELRNKFHLKITTKRVRAIDRDGLIAHPGVYYLEPESRDEAQRILALP